jgi:transposase-like protein
MSRASYTDEDRARVYLALTVNQGNIKRTARDTQVPISTVRAWKTDWEKAGPSQEVVVAAEAQAEVFVEDAERIRHKALLEYEKLVDLGEVKAKDLMVGVGILTEKISMARGLARKEPQDHQVTMNKGDLREIAAGFVLGALEDARRRENEIQGVSVEQAEFVALPEPKE